MAPLAKNIRFHRETLGLSQKELAERSGLPPSAISLMERGIGNPSFVSVLKVARGLGLPMRKLTETYKVGFDPDF